MSGITQWLELNGFNRAATVREAGDYAVRGGILDLFAPGMDEPVRLDFFGDTLESIRTFDPETQRSITELRALDLVPVSEFQLTSDTIRLFRTGYVAAFGAAAPDDVLYEAVSEGRRYAGMEHWLPLFHKQMETLFDYLGGAATPASPSPRRGEGRGEGARTSPPEPPHPNPLPAGERGRAATPILLEPLAEDAAHERLAQIADYYEARRAALDQTGGGAPYKPLPPDRLYLAEAEWRERLDKSALARLSPFAAPEGTADAIEIAARAGKNFTAERNEPGKNVFEALTKHVEALHGAGKRAIDRACGAKARASAWRMCWPSTACPISRRWRRGRRRWRCRAPRSRSRCSASTSALRPRTSRSSPRKTFWASVSFARAANRNARKISSPR